MLFIDAQSYTASASVGGDVNKETPFSAIVGGDVYKERTCSNLCTGTTSDLWSLPGNGSLLDIDQRIPWLSACQSCRSTQLGGGMGVVETGGEKRKGRGGGALA